MKAALEVEAGGGGSAGPSEAGRILSFVSKHEGRDVATWPCPGCGDPICAPLGGAPESEADKLCYDCATRAVRRPDRRPAAAPFPRRFDSRAAGLGAHGVPAEYQRAFVDQAWPTDPRRPTFDIGAWSGSPWSVTFAGVVSGGKTMLATEIFWRRLPWVRSAFWTRMGTAVRAAFGDFGEERSKDMTGKLFDSELLLLDDLGRGHDGRAWSFVVEVVSHRHEHRMPTIITTNRRLRTRDNDKELGLQDEDPAFYRRIEEGVIAGFARPWAAGGAA
jgi:hypothetical protein